MICPYFEIKKCNSCNLLEFAEECSQSKYAEHKNSILESGLHSFIELGAKLYPLKIPANIFPSRVKAKLSVGGSVNDPVLGLLKDDLRVSELENCPLHLPLINEILNYSKIVITTHRLTPYSINNRSGELKSIIVIVNHDCSEAILRFVLRSKEALDRIRLAMANIINRFPQIRVVSANIQPIPHAILEGPEEIILSENKVIWEKFNCNQNNEFQLAFGPQSFVQVTYDCASLLYETAAQKLVEHGASCLLDLFCGVGGFSFAASPFIKWGIGVELSEDAIASANLAKEKYEVDNLSFFSQDVELFLSDYQGKIVDAALLNPPRRGLSENIIGRVIALEPKVILYSSCNYLTLARDLEKFGSKYQVKEFIPFDMFPYTDHVEVLAVLTRG